MKKDPDIAAVLSFIPEAGLVYCGQTVTGVGYFLWSVLLVFWIIDVNAYQGDVVIPIVLLIITWVNGLFDARRVAIKLNHSEGNTKSQNS